MCRNLTPCLNQNRMQRIKFNEYLVTDHTIFNPQQNPIARFFVIACMVLKTLFRYNDKWNPLFQNNKHIKRIVYFLLA